LISLIQQYIQKKILEADIQAQAFDSFYQQLLSSSYPRYSSAIQGHQLPCYNLLSYEELNFLRDYLKTLEGDLLDYGCGLSFLAPLLKPHQKMKGIDFSKFALRYNRQYFSAYEFEAFHLNMTPKLGDSTHMLINDAFYHFPKPLVKIRSLLSQKPSSLYWVHNFKDPIEELSINGYEIKSHNFTPQFEKLVKSWSNILSSTTVQEERKIYPLIWDTLEKEMSAHKKALEQGKLHRFHLTFKAL